MCHQFNTNQRKTSMKAHISIKLSLLLLFISSSFMNLNPIKSNNSPAESYLTKSNTKIKVQVNEFIFTENQKKTSPDLINFEAIKNGDRVEAVWEINSISGYKGFTLEKSRNGKDFTKICSISSCNSINSNVKYMETDLKPFSGISYYRLKLTDQNKNDYYSKIVPVNYYIDKNSTGIYTINKNAEFLQMNISNLKNKEALIVIRDSNGKEFYTKTTIDIENSELIGINPEKNITPGSYLVLASSNNLLYSQKIIISDDYILKAQN